MSKRRLAYELYSLRDMVNYIPMQRGHQTLYRWATVGAPTAGGKTVKLKTVLVAGKMHTHLDLFEEFLQAMQH